MTLVKTTYNRRSFLKVSATASGGLVLGFSWLASCKPTPAEALAMPEEWFDINAFLSVGDNGVVTIMSPNPEIGQGVKTAMPMIVAEELDVDWKKVVVKQAGLDSESFSRQVAGGSQSIRQSWDGLRMAGATARRMLMQAAADQWQVPVEELSTDAGVISHAASDRTIGYGEVASLASTVRIPDEVELKDSEDFKIIGSFVRNVDNAAIATGEPLFGMDVYREGMLIAMITHAPAFGMKLKSVDDTQARRMPGIRDVFVINTKPEGVEESWSVSNIGSPESVVVVGNTTWEVLNAKSALRIEWEVDSALESTAGHAATLTELATAPADPPERQDGDPDGAFRQAAKTLERTYEAPFLAHNAMEPMNFFAYVTETAAEFEGPTQTPASLRSSAAAVLGLDESQVGVMMTRMGGGFGRRLYNDCGIEAALISQKTGAPVKLVYTREDDMTQGTYRPAYKVAFRAAVDAQNNLTGLQVAGAGADGGPVFPNRFPAGAIDNYKADRERQSTNITTGAWRAPRSNFMAFAEQSFLDELAELLERDPIAFRLELLKRAEDDPVGSDNDYDPVRYAGVLKLVREKCGWGDEPQGVFRGVAAYFSHNTYVAEVVDIVMRNGKPRIQKVWCAVDCGIVVNKAGALNQVEGAIIDGIGHATYSGMTFSDGRPDQQNFDRYRLIRNAEAPDDIEVFFVDNGIDPTGLGEPALPPIAPALANALYKATGERLYRQPFVREQPLLG